ncbi:MAG: hypothetical protein WCK48_03735, partial [bacterium]
METEKGNNIPLHLFVINIVLVVLVILMFFLIFSVSRGSRLTQKIDVSPKTIVTHCFRYTHLSLIILAFHLVF